MTSNPQLPLDHSQRARFAAELDKNFSVIAPAGVGKTNSIVDRVIEIARSARAKDWLPKLIVVTYTNRAADEMQHRARNKILNATRDPDKMQRVEPGIAAVFNRAFFGTIHSLCSRLLRTHGHHLGLPSKLDLIEDDGELWQEFVRKLDRVGSPLAEKQRKHCFRHTSMMDVIRLARKVKQGSPVFRPGENFGDLDFNPILECPPNKRSKGTVENGQQLIREWIDFLEKEEVFLPIPSFDKGGREFVALWRATFEPLRRWLGECSFAVAQEIGQKYREYRVGRGLLTYDDQISLALKLLDNPGAGRRIREEGFRVILDEAQDTDEQQFRVLTELARAPEFTGDWIHEKGDPPCDGRFCMVGDPQQSIYGERANLVHYQKIRERLTRRKPSEELSFEVTFRCDRAIIHQVNELVPVMLDGREGQVPFVPLHSRPNASQGQVVRLDIRRTQELEPRDRTKFPEWLKARVEAQQLVGWLNEQGLEKLRAPDWSKVAILCPRKKWLNPIAVELQKVGIKYQIQSTNDIQGDSPACAWLTALALVMAQPRNSYEIVGVLREVFGLSDQQLADFSEDGTGRFQVEEPTPGSGPVERTLSLLAKTRPILLGSSLRDAVVKLIDATRLRNRLSSVDIQPLEDELDDLLIQAAIAEADGLSLTDWAANLQKDFVKTMEAGQEKKDALQLITCQKAKGLQWNAVIIPFMFRKIRNAGPKYPGIIEVPSHDIPLVVFDETWMGEEDKERLSLNNDHESQRVLYVAMTRARHTLVLVNDSEIFKPDEKSKTRSFAEHLSVLEGENAKRWNNISTVLTPSVPEDSSPLSPESSLSTVALAKEEVLPLQSSVNFDHALTRARQFPQRTLPHSLAKPHSDEEPELQFDLEPEWLRPVERDTALQYGTWWHEFMEHFPWLEKMEAWARYAAKATDLSPDPHRAKKEWTMFQASNLAPQLSRPDLVIHPEMPFLCPQDPTHCIEGLIDLAVFHLPSNAWFLVDWKTDQIRPSDLEILRQRYSPQIEAYAQALHALTKLTVKASLYSTATGREISVV